MSLTVEGIPHVNGRTLCDMFSGTESILHQPQCCPPHKQKKTSFLIRDILHDARDDHQVFGSDNGSAECPQRLPTATAYSTWYPSALHPAVAVSTELTIASPNSLYSTSSAGLHAFCCLTHQSPTWPQALIDSSVPVAATVRSSSPTAPTFVWAIPGVPVEATETPQPILTPGSPNEGSFSLSSSTPVHSTSIYHANTVQATTSEVRSTAVRNSPTASTPSLPPPRKIRRNRTVFTELQLMGLERRFDSQKYLSTPDRAELARALGLTQLQVKTWYQNRRMKWKKQVMQGGCPVPPTKPKGRPKKNSIPSLSDSQPASTRLDTPPAVGSPESKRQTTPSNTQGFVPYAIGTVKTHH